MKDGWSHSCPTKSSSMRSLDTRARSPSRAGRLDPRGDTATPGQKRLIASAERAARCCASRRSPRGATGTRSPLVGPLSNPSNQTSRCCTRREDRYRGAYIDDPDRGRRVWSRSSDRAGRPVHGRSPQKAAHRQRVGRAPDAAIARSEIDRTLEVAHQYARGKYRPVRQTASAT